MIRDDEILKGLIPWEIEDFKEVNAHLYQLLQKPKDDWDLRQEDLPVNVYEPIGQIAQFMKKKYDEETLFKAHFIRYNNIILFIRKYKEQLKELGFVQEGLIPLIKDQLLKCLCSISFNEIQSTEDGYIEYCFDLNEVILKTKKIL